MTYPTTETIRQAWQTQAEVQAERTASAAERQSRAQAEFAPSTSCKEILDNCVVAASACCEGLPAVPCGESNSQVLLTSSNPNPPTILDEAARITSIDRNKTYGPPRDNHSRTAALWQAYLSGLNGRPLDYRDVCWLNVLQKASRDVFCRGRDNLTDSAGYMRNVEMADNDEGRA